MFDCFHANAAWGVEETGFYVARDGRVGWYDHRGPRESSEDGESFWEQRPPARRISGSDLQRRYRRYEIVVRLPRSLVDEKVALIEASERSDTEQIGFSFDAGSTRCVAYRYFDHDASYEAILLGSEGDRIQRRDSEAGRALYYWLHQVGREARRASEPSLHHPSLTHATTGSTTEEPGRAARADLNGGE